MSFFDARSFQEPRLSMDHFREWAGAITNSYLHSGVDPTTSLTKIAQDEELTPDQIKLLATETNKLVHQHKYASAGEKYHAADFPLCDAQKVINSLQVDGGTQKIAVELPDPVCKDQMPDPYAMFGVEPEMIDKTASVKSGLKALSEKTALLKQKSEDAVFLAKHAAANAERAFIKEARQVVLCGSNPAERLHLLGQVYTMTKSASLEQTAKPALAKLAHVLVREGLVEKRDGNGAVEFFLDKIADQKAPEALISGFLNARVVNGQHPLYITLKTFHDSKSALDLSVDRHQVIDDRNQVVRQKIRAL